MVPAAVNFDNKSEVVVVVARVTGSVGETGRSCTVEGDGNLIHCNCTTDVTHNTDGVMSNGGVKHES